MVMSFTMETIQNTRQEIITLYNEGYSKTKSSRDIGVSYKTVALWIRRYEETGNTDNSVRPSLISTMQGCQLHALSSIIYQNPSSDLSNCYLRFFSDTFRSNGTWTPLTWSMLGHHIEGRESNAARRSDDSLLQEVTKLLFSHPQTFWR